MWSGAKRYIRRWIPRQANEVLSCFRLRLDACSTAISRAAEDGCATALLQLRLFREQHGDRWFQGSRGRFPEAEYYLEI